MNKTVKDIEKLPDSLKAARRIIDLIVNKAINGEKTGHFQLEENEIAAIIDEEKYKWVGI